MSRKETIDLSNEELDNILDYVSAIHYLGQTVYVSSFTSSTEWEADTGEQDEGGRIYLLYPIDDGATEDSITYDELRAANATLFILEPISYDEDEESWGIDIDSEFRIQL